MAMYKSTSLQPLLTCLSLLAAGTIASTAHASKLCDGITPIYEIQGKSHVSPHLGDHVVTCGVVTAVAFNGYYLQDPVGDDDPETSDGIFVFVSSSSKPALGTLLRVSDTVSEFIPGGANTGNLSITQLSFPQILAEQAGHPLPAAVIIGRNGVMPPNEIVISVDETDPPVNLQNQADAETNTYNPEVDGLDFYESLESMLVSIEDPVAVSATRQFGTFSAEVFVLADDGRGVAPKDARTTRGGIALQPHPDNLGDQNPERVQIQFDATLYGSTDYPSITVGDRLSDVTGVVGYSFGNYEVNALSAVTVDPGRTRQEYSCLSGKKNALSIASYNVLNLSAVEGDNAQREKIATQIVTHLNSPDIIALQEIQDNNGDVNDCDEDNPGLCANDLNADLTLQRLIDAIVSAGGPAYDFINVDPKAETTQTDADGPDVFGGVSLGNIRNAFLYNPARVELDGYTGLSREVLMTRYVSQYDAFDYSRDPLEAVFKFNGEKVIVINNHFSSRFGSTPIFGGPQPFIQAGEEARESQADVMYELVQAHLNEDREAKVIVLGDLNTFEFTNDLTEILPGQGSQRLLRTLSEKLHDDNRYTFNFEGNSQILDHVFVTENLYKQASYDIVHINVDFPRLDSDTTASDHEPLLTVLKIKAE